MESLGYIFIHFFRKGNIFGKKQFKSREEKLKYYEDWKLSFIPETMNSEMPQEFINYLNYIKSMNVIDSPEYETWKKSFKQLIQKLGISQNDYAYEWIPKIKNDMIQQYGNSFLLELETPLETSAMQKDTSRYSQAGNDFEDKEKQPTALNLTSKANSEETTQAHTKEQKQSETTIQGVFPQLQFYQHQQQNMQQNSVIQETQESVISGGGYYYGAVEIEMTDAQIKQTANSNITFGADSENKQKQNNGSVLENFSTYNKKSQLHSSQHLHTSQNLNNNNNRSDTNYSCDDLNICDDETQNSLSILIISHNYQILNQPFSFKSKQID